MNTPDSQKPNQQPASKEQSAATKSNAIEVPSIALPKGGGAIKSIDEKFSVNAANGTAGFSIPFPFSPSRNGFMPSMALSYNSGSGNGIFGLGWSADPPSITRKTDKKLPEYNDAEESDVFLFSGAEDLVPKYDEKVNPVTGKTEWIKDENLVDGITRYRPRIEGGFARIEKITDVHGIAYWKVTSRGNVVSIFGKSKSAQIHDPANPAKIFKWLLEFNCDDKGNCFQFVYENEDEPINFPDKLNERNRRNGIAKYTNAYLTRIKYCNKAHFDRSTLNTSGWEHVEYLLELVLDYKKTKSDNPQPEDTGWDCRDDVFSDYRSGFDIRTYRICHRVLMFHHFKELNEGYFTDSNDHPCLVRSLDLQYDHGSAFTFLKSIAQTGYVRKTENTYAQRSLPPVKFTYEKLGWSTEIKSLPKESLENLPVGIDDQSYQWIDLHSEGLSGILTEQANGWYYKSNFGEGNFEALKLVPPKPAMNGLSNGAVHFQDLEANGQKFLVSNDLNGFYEYTPEDEWLPFKAFNEVANINLHDANTKMLDLNGDGKADILISEDDLFVWYASKGKQGYDSYRTTRKNTDEEKGPNIVFADSTQSIVLADMSGDGLMDIVRIRCNDIAYWPNLGYGKFGAKVSMSNAPAFDHPDHFNPKYIKLGDLDGSGTTDIVYLADNSFKIYFNQSGNSWSDVNIVEGPNPLPFPAIDDYTNVNIIDLLGNGTGCIVWSSPLPAYSQNPLRYIDLMGGKKPHVMNFYKNNMGKEVTMDYKPSTYFYLEDKKAGHPWITKLPFPVQCVSKVAITDSVTNLRFANLYTYHHGYYDYAEKEFRGFGMVEQTDTEEYEPLLGSGASNATDIQFHEPPVLTKTWYHLGAYIRHQKILEHYVHEYWYNNPALTALHSSLATIENKLPDASLSADLSAQEIREANRACKGMVLRQEVFALDGSGKELLPYSVATHNCDIKMLQPTGGNKHAVFIVHESEAISYMYERYIEDPRIAHTLNLEIDEYGNVLKSVSVVYGRDVAAANTDIALLDNSLQHHQAFIKTAQTKEHLVYTETKVTVDADEPLNYYRLPVPWSVKTFEVYGVAKNNTSCFQRTDFNDILNGINLTPLEYHEQFNTAIPQLQNQLRLIEWVETLLVSYDLTNPLPAGKHGALGLPYESYQLAYTPAFITDLQHKDKLRVGENDIINANYCHIDHDPNDVNWWIRSGKVQYFDAVKGETRAMVDERFYVPISFTDPFGSTTNVSYPANNTFLFIEKTTDALSNTVSVEAFDYRVLAPAKMKDINDNLSAVSFNILGMVVGMAVMGKVVNHVSQADDLDYFIPDIPDAEVADFFDAPFTNGDPFTKGRNLLQHATARMLYDFKSIPVKVATIARETHYRDENRNINPDSKLQYSFEYTGGMGNSVLKKIQAPPGPAIKIENGHAVVEPNADPRWIGNGRTILNNKGKPVKQYEPYFSTTHLYEAEPALRERGVTPVLHYDAAGRLVRTDLPDGTFTKVEFDAWQQKTFDQNDTITESKWAALRGHPNDIIITTEELDAFKQKLKAFDGDYDNEKEALTKSLIHADTPSTVLTDSLGRPFYSIAHNKWIDRTNGNTVNEFAATRIVLDIEGNTRAVIDAMDNTVMQYEFDMLGHTIHSISMDAGKRWIFNDCMGKPKFAWDDKGNLFETEYDVLHRPTGSKLFRNNQHTSSDYFETMEYGTDKLKNLNGLPILHKDTAGLMKIIYADFKGNIKNSSRQLCTNSDEIPDWINMSSEIFTSLASFDAMNRVTAAYSPHSPAMVPSITNHEYNESGLLNKVLVNVNNTGTTEYVKRIERDAKGQRQFIAYGNGTFSSYDYDTETFRLRRLQTKPAGGGNDAYQDLSYTYDPVGNIINIEDKAQKTYYFNNQQIVPENNYRYDALYRLIEAKGREHIGQNAPANAYDSNRKFKENIPMDAQTPSPNSENTFRNYTQYFTYDAVGNILLVQHTGVTYGGWKRNYWYNNIDANKNLPGVFDIAERNNQLLQTTINNDSPVIYTHDAQGCMLQLEHLQNIEWNFKDQVRHIQIQAVSSDNDNADRATYLYDGSGQRIRKEVTKGNIIEERIYFGGFEIFRKKDNGTLKTERETLHIMDDKSRIAMAETLTIENGAPPPLIDSVPLIRFQYSNHLGSAALELDMTARIISYEEYHPYGTTAYQNQNKNIKAAAKRYRYTGMERDEESGLAYHSARYYLPWLGRWLSADPIGIRDGFCLYRYVNNNPISFNDLNGNARVTIAEFGDDEKPIYANVTVVEFDEGEVEVLESKATEVEFDDNDGELFGKVTVGEFDNAEGEAFEIEVTKFEFDAEEPITNFELKEELKQINIQIKALIEESNKPEHEAKSKMIATIPVPIVSKLAASLYDIMDGEGKSAAGHLAALGAEHTTEEAVENVREKMAETVEEIEEKAETAAEKAAAIEKNGAAVVKKIEEKSVESPLKILASPISPVKIAFIAFDIGELGEALNKLSPYNEKLIKLYWQKYELMDKLGMDNARYNIPGSPLYYGKHHELFYKATGKPALDYR